MKRLFALFFILLACKVFAQENEILVLTGATSMEELDLEVIEHFQSLSESKLRINSASAQTLIDSGILTTYQAAVICDYRKRHGDIVSLTELALLDGFSRERVNALRPFISLESAPGKEESVNIYSRFCTKTDSDYSSSTLKADLRHGAWNAGFALRSAYSEKEARPSAFVEYSGRNGSVKLGDYSIRYGQGLLVWNGFSMSGFSPSGDFVKNGVMSRGSISSSAGMRGIAANTSRGAFGGLLRRYDAFAFYDISKKGEYLPGAGGSISLAGLRSQAGLNFIARADEGGGIYYGLSIDGRTSVAGVLLFAEVAADIINASIAGLAGIQWNWAYGKGLNLVLYNYPENYNSLWANPIRSGSAYAGEYGIAAALHFGNFASSLGMTCKDSRLTLQWEKSGKFRLVSKQRLMDGQLKSSLCGVWRLLEAEKPRASISTEIKAQITKYQSVAGAAYAESIFQGKDELYKLMFWTRATIFMVDNWDDRISFYERDAPGSFSVPALYGRGWQCSAGGSWTAVSNQQGKLSLYLRASLLHCTRLSSGELSRSELRLTARYNFKSRGTASAWKR